MMGSVLEGLRRRRLKAMAVFSKALADLKKTQEVLEGEIDAANRQREELNALHSGLCSEHTACQMHIDAIVKVTGGDV